MTKYASNVELCVSAQSQRSSIAISEQGRERLQSLMPYESMSYEEFLMEMADVWENQRADNRSY